MFLFYCKIPEVELWIEFSELVFNRRSKSDLLEQYLKKRPVALNLNLSIFVNSVSVSEFQRLSSLK